MKKTRAVHDGASLLGYDIPELQIQSELRHCFMFGTAEFQMLGSCRSRMRTWAFWSPSAGKPQARLRVAIVPRSPFFTALSFEPSRHMDFTRAHWGQHECCTKQATVDTGDM